MQTACCIASVGAAFKGPRVNPALARRSRSVGHSLQRRAVPHRVLQRNDAAGKILIGAFAAGVDTLEQDAAAGVIAVPHFEHCVDAGRKAGDDDDSLAREIGM